MLLNEGRAREVMDRRHLDGLVAQLPINVYYLTDYWGQLMDANFDWAYFAVLPRATAAAPGLVLPALDVRSMLREGTWVPNIVTYTDRPAPGAAATAGGGAVYGGWPVRPNVPLATLAQTWVDGLGKYCATTSATAIDGLVRALREAGLEGRTIGVDDERLVQRLPQAGLRGGKIVYARETFNEIRLVKTPAEIHLLREAATINEGAVLEAIAALKLGATWHEIERTYMVAMARQGARGVYIACAGGLQTGRVVAGEPIMFDGLGKYRGYHGDFGRTAVVGAPGPDVEARVRAIQAGWTAAYDLIRPGITYSQIKEQVVRAVKAAGFPGAFRPPVPHSLGLEHTDDPKPIDLPADVKPDRALEENMVINVDLPHVEIGWGAVHLEDTVRVTKDGCEPLTSMQTDLRRIAA